jgi:hypothetical protein
MRVYVLVFFISLAGCEKGRNLSLNLKHMIQTSYEKPSDCKELGKVSGFTLSKLGFTRSYEASLKSILRATHDKGGNFVFIERASSDGTNLAGISYACKN